MKKFAASLLTLAVVLCGLNAFAAETDQDVYDVYFGSDNSVHFADYNSDVSKYTTVLIRKADTTGANGVVYVDQQSRGFSDAVNFMLKDGVDDGTYTATFGNSNNDTKQINFVVGDITATGEKGTVKVDQDNKMKVVDEPEKQEVEDSYVDAKEGVYKKGFVYDATLNQFNKFERLYLVSADGMTFYGGFELYDNTEKGERPEYTGDGTVAFGIQIYNIPEEMKGMNLYLGEASN